MTTEGSNAKDLDTSLEVSCGDGFRPLDGTPGRTSVLASSDETKSSWVGYALALVATLILVATTIVPKETDSSATAYTKLAAAAPLQCAGAFTDVVDIQCEKGSGSLSCGCRVMKQEEQATMVVHSRSGHPGRLDMALSGIYQDAEIIECRHGFCTYDCCACDSCCSAIVVNGDQQESTKWDQLRQMMLQSPNNVLKASSSLKGYR